MTTILVRQAGLLTTVQDLGRPGYRKHGVVLSGAADALAARIANILVGNAEDAAVLEATVTGPTLAFESDALIAIGGARLSPTVDGSAIPEWRPIQVRKGSELAFGACVAGCRAYIAVSGGIDVPVVMGSRSTYLRAGVGGFEGRALRRGDALPVGRPPRHSRPLKLDESRSFAVAGWSASRDLFLAYSSEPMLRVILGPQLDWLAPGSRATLFSGRFTVTQNSDRMGARLAGPELSLGQPRELISEAVAPGTVQVTPDGTPIVLLADCQTTGGYPKAAHVISVDLPLIAQLKPGDTLRFTEVSIESARDLLLAREREVQKFKAGVRLATSRG